MTFLTPTSVLLVSIFLGSIPVLNAVQACEVEAQARCIITDTREEFSEYTGMDCKLFKNRHIIDKEKVMIKSYTGIINKNGFPQIAVNYSWKMCNANQADEQIKLLPAESSAFYKDVPQQIKKSRYYPERKMQKVPKIHLHRY
mmetsp:Transcript_19220/g.29140  ORF Transcript_19220/g.29140 Transcript_19220/m.29140 type:complete len:143 (-) Transcript_19220:1415-1843(-)